MRKATRVKKPLVTSDQLKRGVKYVLDRLWLFDISTIAQAECHYPKHVPGTNRAQSAEIMREAIFVRARRDELPWRFIFFCFHKNEAGEESYGYLVKDDLPPSVQTNITHSVHEAMDAFVATEPKDTYVSHGWVAFCSDAVDLTETLENMVEHLAENCKAFDTEAVEKAKQLRKLRRTIDVATEPRKDLCAIPNQVATV